MRKWIIALSILGTLGCSTWGSQNKQKAEIYLRMGAAQIEGGNYPFAIRDLLMAESLDSSNPVIQNNLGLAYFLREHSELAEKHLENAVSLDPKYTEARNNLARVYIEEGKYPAAEKQLAIVLSDLTFPNPEKAYINRGLAQFNQNKFQAARESFAKALSSVSDDCVAHTYFGRTYFELNDYSQAAEALDRAIGFCQKNLFDEPHYFSALAYYRLGEKSRSIARFEELLKYYPNGKYREKAKGMLSLIRKGN